VSPSGDEASRPLCLVEAFYLVKLGRVSLLPILIASLYNALMVKKLLRSLRSLDRCLSLQATSELERQRPRWLFHLRLLMA